MEKLAYVDLRLRAVQAEIDALNAAQTLLELQLKSIEGQIEFKQLELDGILQRIEDERRWAIDTLESPDSADSDCRLVNA